MFLLLFYDKKIKLDYIEMVLDWESAKYTKPDKPLNAYDTLYRFYPHLVEQILPILKRFKIDKSTLDMDEDVVEYVNSLKEYDEEDIKKELIEYIKEL